MCPADTRPTPALECESRSRARPTNPHGSRAVTERGLGPEPRGCARLPTVQTLIENPQAHVVEGSNGLLLEIDGQIVPNYDATMQPFEEGEVVTGNVVRIDKDEVLVDIGYKSEGVIPANELSIRKSVDPREEVSLGEEVDEMVLT
jgi:hypothetical protein